VLSLSRLHSERTVFLVVFPDRVHQQTGTRSELLMMDEIFADGSADKRLAKVGTLLAEALTRLQRRKSSRFSGGFGESSLHISADQSGDAPPRSAEASHE
jgi:hypothetical protein